MEIDFSAQCRSPARARRHDIICNYRTYGQKLTERKTAAVASSLTLRARAQWKYELFLSAISTEPYEGLDRCMK